MLLLMAVFDSVIYERGFFQSLFDIYPFELGTRRTIVSSVAVLGFIIAVYIDYKDRKKSTNQQTSE